MALAEATVHQLHLGGGKQSDDWTEADAVDLYMELHPAADRAAVEAQLRAAIAVARENTADKADLGFVSRPRRPA